MLRDCGRTFRHHKTRYLKLTKEKRLGPTSGLTGDAGPSRVSGPDDPIPSIESDDCGVYERASARSPTPSISVDTPDDDSLPSRVPDPSFPNSPSPRLRQSHAGSISDRLEELHLRSSASPSSADRFSLDSLGAALPSVGEASRHQTPVLLLPGGSPRASGARHRRSSSVNPAPYDVREEAPPQDRFHEPEFQQAFTHAKVLMAQLAGVLGSSALHLEPDSTMRSLRERANELAHFRCPPTRTVGLVGDSGVGMVFSIYKAPYSPMTRPLALTTGMLGQAKVVCLTRCWISATWPEQ